MIKHIALSCSSEDHSDRFYQKLLGLDKMEPKWVTADLLKQIFNIDRDMKIINYTGNDVQFEIFINDSAVMPHHRIDHVCIEVNDLVTFLANSKALNLEVIQMAKADKILTFIRDFDRNLFEIKEK